MSLLTGVHAFTLAFTQEIWSNETYVLAMVSVWILLLPIIMVCVLALAMSICTSAESATQFAIYMSVANLGHSAGSKLFGMVSEQTTYPQSYMLLSILVVGMIAVLFFHRHQHQEAASDDGRVRRIYTIASGAGEGGMFFSGAMRCPKCRSDMQQLDVDGTVIREIPAETFGAWRGEVSDRFALALADALRRSGVQQAFREFVASVSVGIWQGVPVLDLDYAEDSTAETDMNVVMGEDGGFIEVQGTAEGMPFAREQLDGMLDLASAGISELVAAQKSALAG